MTRREFLTLLGGSAVAWPLGASAQQPSIPVIGFLNGGSPDKYAQQVAAFRKGLAEAGYIEGQNLAVEYRWAEGQLGRLPALAHELVLRQVAVLVTSGSLAAATARSATTTIPIVFNVTDPVRLGLASSLSRPGGNATGVNVMAGDLGPIRLGLLRDLLPKVNSVALLVNPTSPVASLQSTQMEEAAGAIGVQLQIFKASRKEEFAAAFADLVRNHVDAIVVAADPAFNDGRDQLVTLAARHAVPAVYEWREFVDAGGLMSYGANLKDTYRQIGAYTARILKGDKPADLPIEQPTKFELVINAKTAKALGLSISPTLLARADEMIE
jgi:putative ABC transport system substrate-binding protein